MRPDDIRDFLRRDRTIVEESRAAYWRTLQERLGPSESLRIADELRREAEALRPGGPSAEERAADLASHLRVSEMLRRVPAKRAG